MQARYNCPRPPLTVKVAILLIADFFLLLKMMINNICHSENTVPLKEMNTMMSFLYLINTLSSASSSKSPQVDTFLHWDTESSIHFFKRHRVLRMT
jgi:hypothetical protein